MQPTPEQAAVIGTLPGNILVSAAAGSGKTAVLTDRIVRRVASGELDIRQVLIMTFTEAAAREMKERIAAKLAEAGEAAADPAGRRRMSRQIALLAGSSISTIHAFCLDVIRNFYLYARDSQGGPLVTPGFYVEDGQEAALLLRQTLDEYLDRQYELIDWANNPASASGTSKSEAAVWDQARQDAFYHLMDGYGDSRGDQAVRQLILSLHQFLRSLPDYRVFVAERLAELEQAASDFPSSPHARELMQSLALCLDHALEAGAEMQEILDGGVKLAGDKSKNDTMSQRFAAMIRSLRQMRGELDAGGPAWDPLYAAARELDDFDLPRASRFDSPEKQRLMELFRDHVAETLHLLTGQCGTEKYRQGFLFEPRVVFDQPAAAIEAELAAMLPPLRLLFELVLGLDDAYAAKKRAAGCIDFSDFEHLALAILGHEEVRQYYRSRFWEIYVDEYQDTSSIQEAIIRAVNSGNCLMVGDIKQSIYRFRHARPRLFLEKAASFRTGCDGRLFELNRNFRSVPGVIAAVNEVFGQLMSPGAGEIDYDGSQALVPQREADPSCPRPVNLLLVARGAGVSIAGPAASPEENGEDEDSASPEDATLAEELGRDQEEALAVVRAMRQLAEQGQDWKNMVVLCRTRAIASHYGELLGQFGIPFWLQAAESFLDAPVMRQMEALVHLLDNRLQDIPLAAVMRSGLFGYGFSNREMARIRLECPGSRRKPVSYAAAVMVYAERGPDPDLRTKLCGFLAWLDRLRQKEQIMPLGELIGLIYAESGCFAALDSQLDGPTQIKRLRQFQLWAEKFEANRQRGLYAFARYLEVLRSQEDAEPPYAAAMPDENRVRILTIHGSKGLEFPIVFLVGTGYGISPRDSRDSVLISEKLGIGMDFCDPAAQIRYPSHLKLAMQEEIKAASLAEEMRLLYVAMTRARDRLYIAGTVKLDANGGNTRLAELVRQSSRYGDKRLPAHLVLSARSTLEWLILSLARQPGLDWTWLEMCLAASWSGCSANWSVSADPAHGLLRELIAASRSPAAPDTDSLQPAVPAALTSGQPGELAAQTPRPPEADLPEQPDAASWQQIFAEPYRVPLATRLPAKVSVSELKRQSQIWSVRLPDNESAPPGQLRGINLSLRGYPPDEQAGGWPVPQDAPERPDRFLPPQRLGQALHTCFRLLDLAAACADPSDAEMDRQIAAMCRHGALSDAEAAAVRGFLPQFGHFARSGLAGEMSAAAADPRHLLCQEIPFTLAVPAASEVPGQDGLEKGDRILVQGIIDAWYENADGITLIDYKSDILPEDPAICLSELKQRYGGQLAYYARAIEAAAGKPVKRRLIWMIRQSKAYELPP